MSARLTQIRYSYVPVDAHGRALARLSAATVGIAVALNGHPRPAEVSTGRTGALAGRHTLSAVTAHASWTLRAGRAPLAPPVEAAWHGAAAGRTPIPICATLPSRLRSELDAGAVGAAPTRTTGAITDAIPTDTVLAAVAANRCCGADATLTAVTRGARIAIIAGGPIRLSWIGTHACGWIADPCDMALIERGAGHGIAPEAASTLAGISLGAGIAIVTARAIGDRLTQPRRGVAALALGAGDGHRTGCGLT